MADPITLSKGPSDVPGRGLSVAVDTLRANEPIERLKPFCGKEDGGSELPNMFDNVEKDVEFRLVEPPRCPFCSTCEEALDGRLEFTLRAG